MKILFSPEYNGHVYVGLNPQQPELMDTMVCDTLGLVAMLELRMGIHVEEQAGKNRTVLYYKAMSEYMKKHPNNILAASFKLSGLGTAEQALRWRDSLEVLAGTEPYFDCAGLPGRISTILQYFYKKVAKNTCIYKQDLVYMRLY